LSKKRKSTRAISGRLRTAAFALCLLLAAFLIWLDHTRIRPRWQRQPESQEQARACDFEKYQAKTFAVINVVDGDTIDIDIPDDKYNRTRIRLWGIDTPETNMYFGPEAADFTKASALGKQVTIYLDEGNRTRGKYGRLLAYVQLPDGRFLNEVLLTEGYAYADLRFQHSFYNKYTQLQAVARRQKKGLWPTC
jgi:endonuclease YncB( thermonuclease family)